MPKKKLSGVAMYVDQEALDAGMPGIYNTFVSGLGGALLAKGQTVDAATLMGDTGWAFRILVHKELCPSAMSVFDWTSVLTQSIEQTGYDCRYVARYWHEQEMEEARRLEGQKAILSAIDAGDPAIVWDIGIPEWGLIVGYDTEAAVYDTIGCDGSAGTMLFEELGQREIRILSVAVLTEPNGRPRAERERRAVEIAVEHARHQEWLDRDNYQDGPEAYETWAAAIDRANQSEVNWDFAGYYAGHYYGARCYARDYLQSLEAQSDALRAAADAYNNVAACLRPVWQGSQQPGLKDKMSLRRELATILREAGTWEEIAVAHLENALSLAAAS